MIDRFIIYHTKLFLDSVYVGHPQKISSHLTIIISKNFARVLTISLSPDIFGSQDYDALVGLPKPVTSFKFQQ